MRTLDFCKPSLALEADSLKQIDEKFSFAPEIKLTDRNNREAHKNARNEQKIKQIYIFIRAFAWVCDGEWAVRSRNKRVLWWIAKIIDWIFNVSCALCLNEKSRGAAVKPVTFKMGLTHAAAEIDFDNGTDKQIREPHVSSIKRTGSMAQIVVSRTSFLWILISPRTHVWASAK